MDKETLARLSVQCIQKARFLPIQELILGETGYAFNGKIRLFFEIQRPETKPKGSVLLISRNANTLLFWSQQFIQTFVSEGYNVIRFDHRGIGLSDRMEGWTKKTAYVLEDMARDAMAVLDSLKIKSAHIVGASMGGMIAQRFAYLFPNVTLSLCSIMSSGYYYDPSLVSLSPKMKRNFRSLFLAFYRAKNNFEKQVQAHIMERNLWIGCGDYELDIPMIINEVSYEIKFRKGYYKMSFPQHVKAIKKSGSFLEKLEEISSKALIIHGDSDPLIDINHAKKYVSCLKKGKSYYLSGMGHDIPKEYTPRITNQILILFAASENQ